MLENDIAAKKKAWELVQGYLLNEVVASFVDVLGFDRTFDYFRPRSSY